MTPTRVPHSIVFFSELFIRGTAASDQPYVDPITKASRYYFWLLRDRADW